MFENLLKHPVTNFPIDPLLFVLALGEAFVLGFIVLRVYRYKRHFSTQGEGFQTAMLMMAPLISLILMFIGSNLALSIGMVGALSIVRFRTVLKDPLDLMYLFLLIGVGLGCGTYNFSMTALGTAMILLLVGFSQTRNPTISGGILLVKSADEKKAAAFSADLLAQVPSAFRDRMDLSAHGAEYTFLIAETSPTVLSTIEDLRHTHKIDALTYFNNKNEF